MSEREPADISAVLRYYGADSVPEGGWKSVRCVFHDDRNASGRVSTDDGAYICLSGCPQKGDAYAIIMGVEHCDFPTALEKYRQITGGEAPGFSKKQERTRGWDTDGTPKKYEEGSGMSLKGWGL